MNVFFKVGNDNKLSSNNSKNYPFDKIGDVFLRKGILTEEQVLLILKKQKNTNKLFGELACGLGFITEDNLVSVLSEIYSIGIISLEFLCIEKKILELIDYEFARFNFVVPFFSDDSLMRFAISDPGNLKAIDKIHNLFPNKKIEFFLAKETQILRFLETMKHNENTSEDPLFLMNKIIFQSIECMASDIHFEPNANEVRIRMRIDGILNETHIVDSISWQRMKAKLKLISHLNITENRKPQSGHTRIYLAGKTIDLRISTHPGIFGENFVIRIFDLSNGIKDLCELGFNNDDREMLLKSISVPHGIVLIVGPTGSGKTTTLYSLLKAINSESINIMTLEDPVEYQINGIRQLDLKEEGLLSFSDGIRSILRQDPDVLLIGEIRDEATATSAIRASLTGRLVLATLHSSTPIDAIRRLIDLGVKISDIVPSLVCIFSQRLIRKKEQNCDHIKSEKGTIEHVVYNGRFPITEYILFSKELKEQILTTNDIRSCKAIKTFAMAAKEAIADNLTTKEEVCRVIGDVDI